MKKYALLFTLLTVGLGIAANNLSTMKRWGSGDVINGRDLTSNFDIVTAHGGKKINYNSTISLGTDGGYDTISLGSMLRKNLVATYSSVLLDAGTSSLVALKCYNIQGLEDGGSNYYLHLQKTITNVDFLNKTANGSVQFYVDAGTANCEVQYNGPVYIQSDVLKIEEIP